MATAWAREASNAVGRPVSLGYWSEVFENNPDIVPDGQSSVVVHGHLPGQRPYIIGRYKDCLIFNPHHRPVPGHVYLTDAEREEAKAQIPDGAIIVEPHVKGKVSADNKDWGWQKWVNLAKRRDDFVQLEYGKETLPNVLPVMVNSFRQAMAILARARLFVGTDGGLHHAAAALGIPAVVIWGGYSSPEILGYAGHWNVRAEGVETCGSLKSCSHCREAMEWVSVGEVAVAIEETLGA